MIVSYLFWLLPVIQATFLRNQIDPNICNTWETQISMCNDLFKNVIQTCYTPTSFTTWPTFLKTQSPTFIQKKTTGPTTGPTQKKTTTTGPTAGPLKCRDPWIQPFLSTSIWNTAIGADATFVPANIFSTRLFDKVSADIAWFVQVKDTDPVTPWYNQVSWDHAVDHCAIVNPPTIYKTIAFPANYTNNVCNNCNNCASLLQPDGQTVVQMLGLYRCTVGGPILAEPKRITNIRTSDGMYGSHGGSDLSGIGGTIRPGELLPKTGPITHALNLQLYAALYYYKELLPTGDLDRDSCKTWPAVRCDGYAVSDRYNGTNPALRMGALLAIPLKISTSINSRISSPAGKKLLYALTYYGGYLTDDANQNVATFGVDYEAFTEFKAYYGYKFEQGYTGAPFYKDVLLLFQSLQIVTNNGPKTIGGPGLRIVKEPVLPMCA